MKITCYQCLKPIDLLPSYETSFPRKEECPHCETYLHCCKMCLYYDSMSYNECRESVAERIVDKEKANFCGLFKINQNLDTNPKKTKDDLWSQADALFKKK